MYYVFNRGLDAVLTAKGWVLFNDMKKEEHDIIAVKGKENFDKINKDVINKYYKTISKASILLTQKNLLSNRPKKRALSDEDKRKLNCGANQLVKILCDNEAKKMNSIKIFPRELSKASTSTASTLSVYVDVEEEFELEEINNKIYNEDNMNYFYNEGLDAVLTTKGWIEFNELDGESYLLLAVSNDRDIEEIYANVLGKYTSTITRSTVIISEDTLLNERLKPTVLMDKDITVLHSCVKQLIQILISRNAQIVDVSRIISNKIDDKITTIVQVPQQAFSQIKTSTTDTDSDGMLRIKNEFYNEKNDYVEEAVILLEKSVEIYHKSKEILSKYVDMLKDVEQQINDELHYIEFNQLDEADALKFANNLHKLRNKRRMLKDCLFTANLMLKQFDDDKIEQLNYIHSKLEHLNDRSYVIRSPENFNH